MTSTLSRSISLLTAARRPQADRPRDHGRHATHLNPLISTPSRSRRALVRSAGARSRTGRRRRFQFTVLRGCQRRERECRCGCDETAAYCGYLVRAWHLIPPGLDYRERRRWPGLVFVVGLEKCRTAAARQYAGPDDGSIHSEWPWPDPNQTNLVNTGYKWWRQAS